MKMKLKFVACALLEAVAILLILLGLMAIIIGEIDYAALAYATAALFWLFTRKENL